MSVPQIDLAIAPSRIYGVGLVLVYGATFPVLAVAPMAALWKIIFLLVAIGLAWLAWQAWRRQTSVKRLLVLPDGFRLILANGQEVDAKGGSQTVLTNRLVILHLLSSGGVYWLPLLPDSTDSASFRRLRVWLRCTYTGV